MSLELKTLLSTPFGTPIDELNVELLYAFSNYHKISDHIYIHAYPIESRLSFYGFAWVTSDATATSLFSRERVADDGIRLAPPSVLLPEGKLMCYEEIKVYAQHIDPKYFDDSVGRQRRVRFGDFDFYYRGSFPNSGALPICIEIDRQELMLAGAMLS